MYYVYFIYINKPICLHLLHMEWKDVDQRYVSGRNFYLHTLYTAR